ncbi:MAG: hypothetical protein KDA61_04935, partial [Planctomycetales bacterium]|nr:hypothetical protein [Planctomycetales bacterium]
MRTFLLAGLLILTLGQAAGQDSFSEPEPFPNLEQRPFNLWMDVKLEESQATFAALARADFDAIRKSALELKTMNRLEEFVRRSTPGYSTQLRVFEFGVDEILAQARQKNIEGVTLGFQQLTLSCVNCHKQLRRLEEA